MSRRSSRESSHPRISGSTSSSVVYLGNQTQLTAAMNSGNGLMTYLNDRCADSVRASPLPANRRANAPPSIRSIPNPANWRASLSASPSSSSVYAVCLSVRADHSTMSFIPRPHIRSYVPTLAGLLFLTTQLLPSQSLANSRTWPFVSVCAS